MIRSNKSKIFLFSKGDSGVVMITYSLRDIRRGLTLSTENNIAYIKKGLRRFTRYSFSTAEEANRFSTALVADMESFLKQQRHDIFVQMPAAGYRSNPWVAMIIAPIMAIGLVGFGFWLGASDWANAPQTAAAGDLCGPDGSCATALPKLPPFPTGSSLAPSSGSVSADDFLAGGQRQ